MEQVYLFLKRMIGCVVGVFIGMSLYDYLSYEKSPEMDAFFSHSLQSRIEIRFFVCLSLIVVLFVTMKIIKWRMKNNQKN